MIELIVNNSYSQAKNLNQEQYVALRKLLSYEPDEAAAFFGGFKGSSKRYLIDRKGFFPTGLLETALNLIVEKNYPLTLKDERVRPGLSSEVNLKMNLGKIRPYLAQHEAVAAARKDDRGIISSPTGTGKSLIIAMLINQFKLRALIVVPNVGIREQLREVLKGIFGDLKHISVENIDSPALQKAGKYDVLIVDEAHHAAAKTFHKLNQSAWKDIYYRFFLTATPYRNVASEHLLLKAITGEIIYKQSYQQAVKDKLIVPVEAFYVESPKRRVVEGHTYAQVYSELVVNNQERNEMIAEMLINLNAVDQATLCLVREVKHGRILSEMTGFPFVCGEDQESKSFIDDFNAGEIKSLIGTYGVLGEGVDSRPAKNVIIAGLGKAKSAFQQQVGRAVRNFAGKEAASIILIKDRSHKYTLKHFNEQCKILKEEYDVIAEKLEV